MEWRKGTPSKPLTEWKAHLLRSVLEYEGVLG